MTSIPKGNDQVDQWRSVMFLYDSALKKVSTKIEILNNEFANRYDYNPIEHIKSRLKSAESIVTKLKKDGRSEERRVGKECSEPCRSRWSPYH